jgi:hypothetical protein
MFKEERSLDNGYFDHLVEVSPREPNGEVRETGSLSSMNEMFKPDKENICNQKIQNSENYFILSIQPVNASST